MPSELDDDRRRRLATFYPKTDSPLPDEVLRSARKFDLPASTFADVCRVGLGVEATAVEPLPAQRQGTFHRVARVQLADSRSVFVRINALSTFTRDFTLVNNAWAMDRLRKHGLPSLPVYRVDVSRNDFPFEYEILAEAPGVELSSVTDEPSLLASLGDLGRMLAGIHGIAVEDYGWVDVVPDRPGRGLFDTWRAFVLNRLDDHLSVCESIGAIDSGERERIASAFTEHDSLFDGVSPVLLHGDLSGRNAFVEANRITALIDWEDCLAGDPVFDLAFWATFQPDERHAALLDAYALIRPLPADFEPRFWLYYLRVALSKTVLIRRFGYPDQLPGRPSASRRIQKALARLEGDQEPHR